MNFRNNGHLENRITIYIEQYSKRNNVRITGIQGDKEHETSISVTDQIMTLIYYVETLI